MSKEGVLTSLSKQVSPAQEERVQSFVMRRAPMTDKDVVAGDSCGRRDRRARVCWGFAAPREVWTC
jgi:hypothetical protein